MDWTNRDGKDQRPFWPEPSALQTPPPPQSGCLLRYADRWLCCWWQIAAYARSRGPGKAHLRWLRQKLLIMIYRCPTEHWSYVSTPRCSVFCGGNNLSSDTGTAGSKGLPQQQNLVWVYKLRGMKMCLDRVIPNWEASSLILSFHQHVLDWLGINSLQVNKLKPFLLLKRAKSNSTEQIHLGSMANEFFSCSNTLCDTNEAAVELDLAVHVKFTSCKWAAGQFFLTDSF